MSHTQMRRLKLSRSSEYTNLRHVVPSLRRQRDVGKVEVVTEAARYIDHLHETLIERFVLCGIPDSLKDVLGTDDASQLGSQHIMNLVASMAVAQRQQEQRQLLARQQQRVRRNIHQHPNPLHHAHRHHQASHSQHRLTHRHHNHNHQHPEQSQGVAPPKQLEPKEAPISERLKHISLTSSTNSGSTDSNGTGIIGGSNGNGAKRTRLIREKSASRKRRVSVTAIKRRPAPSSAGHFKLN